MRLLVNEIEVRVAREEDRPRAERLGRLVGTVLERGTTGKTQAGAAGGPREAGRRD